MPEVPQPETTVSKPEAKPAEPQLPIIEHRTYEEFDKARANWDKLPAQEQETNLDKARSLIERQSKWWQERPRKVRNNAWSWTVANTLSAALLIDKAGEKDEAQKAIEKAKEGLFGQVRTNVYPDGSSLDFHDRDAIHYHVFNEVAWLKSAGYLREAGVEIPPDVAEKLERSIQFVEPYLSGEKTHIEFVNSTNQRDEERQKAKGRFGKPFDPKARYPKGSIYSKILTEEIVKFREIQNSSPEAKKS